MDDGLTIGEFARRSGLSISALRFYDRAGLLAPADVDPSNGYRRYADAQVGDAELIRDLRRLDMPLQTIQAFLVASPDVRRKTLRAHLDGLATRLRQAECIAGRLEARIQEKENPMPTMTVDAEALGEAIDQVAPAAGTDPELPLLHTVLIEARDGSLRLVATDRYRLAVRDLVARGGDRTAFRAIVATAALTRIRPTLAPGDVRLACDDHALTVGEDPAAGRLPHMPAEYPAYEKLLVGDPDAHSIVVDRTALVQLLEPTLGRDVLRVTVAGDALSIDTEPPQHLEVVYEGPELVVGLRPAFIHYAVTSSVGPEVMIDITEPHRPVVFRSATDSSYICMVMPIKLQ